MATMAEVIREAVTDFAAKKIGHAVHGGPPPPDFNDHIAAAVAAHFASDAVVERVGMVLRDEYEQDYAIAAWPNLNASDRAAFMASARAAIRAALGEQEGAGRG